MTSKISPDIVPISPGPSNTSKSPLFNLPIKYPGMSFLSFIKTTSFLGFNIFTQS